MNKLHENTTLSFERVLFFSDAVFAIVITLLVLEIKVPHIEHAPGEPPAIGHALTELIPKFLGFIISFFIVGVLWIEHHRIFRFIGTYDVGLILRNLIFLLFVAFVPFPTALFSEYFRSQPAFALYVASFAAAAIAKIWIWGYAVKNREKLMVAEVDGETIKQISRRSWAVPIVCVISIGLSFIAIAFGGFAFPLIPLVAHLLYHKKKVIPA